MKEVYKSNPGEVIVYYTDKAVYIKEEGAVCRVNLSTHEKVVITRTTAEIVKVEICGTHLYVYEEMDVSEYDGEGLVWPAWKYVLNTRTPIL